MQKGEGLPPNPHLPIAMGSMLHTDGSHEWYTIEWKAFFLSLYTINSEAKNSE